jgi:hypothetical protein
MGIDMPRILTVLICLVLLSACSGLPRTATLNLPTALPERASATVTPSPTSAPTLIEKDIPVKTVTPTPVPAMPTLPETIVSLPPEIEEQMADIRQQVSDVRGLSPDRQVEHTLLTPAQLRDHVVQDFEEDYSPEEARQDALVLAAFGLLNPEFDLYDFSIDLFSEQIAGFYDHDIQQMYVVQGEDFSGSERWTYAHEFVHALQDQSFDIKDGLKYDDELCEHESERCAAVRALLEGDASLTSLEWLITKADPEDIQQILAAGEGQESPVLETAPPYVQEDFLFPYLQGQAFVQELYDQGGWEAVDQAYRNPPFTTEQIIHPESYPQDIPQEVEIPDLLPVLGTGWSELDRGVMGEWSLYLILARGIDQQAQLPADQAQAAAAGWGGDAYAVYSHDPSGAVAMVMTLAWDSPAEADEFAEAFRDYASARFGDLQSDQAGELGWTGDQGYHLFSHAGERTTWILAPDAATAQAILQSLE